MGGAGREMLVAAALVALAMAGACAEEAQVSPGTLLVLRYDDSLLPSDRSHATVVVERKGRRQQKIAIADGWPKSGGRDAVAAAFDELGSDSGEGTASLRAVVAGAGDIEVVVQVTRTPTLGTRIGLPEMDTLSTQPRALTLPATPGQTVELFLGRLVQEIALNIVHVAPPFFPPEGHVATPFYALHHQQAEQVVPLMPYRGGKASFNSIFTLPDGSRRFYVIGPGSFYVGAYAFGYGEVKSTGFVVRKADADRTQTFEIAPHMMEPMTWALLTIEADAAAPVERCLDVQVEYGPMLFARDPARPRDRLEELRLRRLYLLRPTHKKWIVGLDDLPAPETVPFGMTGAAWAPAVAEFTRLEQLHRARETEQATLQPGHCVKNGIPVEDADHQHVARIRRVIQTAPPGLSVIAFMGTAKALREVPLFIDGKLHAEGAFAPKGDLSEWTLDHGLLGGGATTTVAESATFPEVHLTPGAITRVRVLVDLGADEPVEKLVETSEPVAIPDFEKELAPPEAAVTRLLSLPPSLEPSIETVQITFDLPIDLNSIAVDVGPDGSRPETPPSIGLGADASVVTISYEYLPLPAGKTREILLRAGAQSTERDVRPMQQSCRLLVGEDEVRVELLTDESEQSR